MRECGILLPVASLPSRYGIGAFSKEAFQFIDQLKEAGQQYWQILPLGPTGYGDSPYQAFSAFAGNPYFIDLEQLTEEGILTGEECGAVDFGENERYIDYGKLYEGRFPLLRRAYERWKQMEFADARAEAVHRLAEQRLREETREYCFYMAVKNAFGGKSWSLWDEDIRLGRAEAVREYRRRLTDEIGFYEFQQMKFEEQWGRLKAYANGLGIRIIGDIPIYVAFDGADSWLHPDLFQFDGENLPAAVAGCPPDAFSATGQLWGNPLFNWDAMEQDGYRWWIERIRHVCGIYDVVRIDHFRGFAGYYAIPGQSKDACGGTWRTGPGIKLFAAVEKALGKRSIIAEDLGFLSEDVYALLRDVGYPGMKVMEFAFDSRDGGEYRPHTYPRNCVAYTGTHDNEPLLGWFDTAPADCVENAVAYLGLNREEGYHWGMMRGVWSSVADLAIVQAQDILGLGHEARMNTPSTLGGNWCWRALPDAFSPALAQKLRHCMELYQRLG